MKVGLSIEKMVNGNSQIADNLTTYIFDENDNNIIILILIFEAGITD